MAKYIWESHKTSDKQFAGTEENENKNISILERKNRKLFDPKYSQKKSENYSIWRTVRRTNFYERKMLLFPFNTELSSIFTCY